MGMLAGLEYELVTLDPSQISVLPQMRKTFQMDKIQDLVVSIQRFGQVNEALVNRVTKASKVQYQLIAGECRLRAIKTLRGTINCKVFDNVPKADFINLQGAENIHSRPLPQEEASWIAGTWQFARKTKELRGMTLREFSHRIGRREEVVRNALKFIETALPEVQNLVNEGIISFGSAVAISRLESEKQLPFAVKAISLGWKTEEVEKRIRQHFAILDSGQSTFLEMQVEELSELSFAVEKKVSFEAAKAIAYFDRLQKVLEMGYAPSKILTAGSRHLISKTLDIRERFDRFLSK